jgi:hypothetical protein
MVLHSLPVLNNPTRHHFCSEQRRYSLTRCASRWAGISAACWLLFLGFAKVAAFITSIPDQASSAA